jgi:3-mercaptopyruvate sulfurtransferase SseA
MSGRIHFLLVILILFTAACTAEPTEIPAPAATPTPVRLPLSEAEVPRVTVDEAKAALERGEAVMVDVRSAEAFAASHVAGALNIQLGEIETNPTGLNLDKEQWIITYCT